MNTISITKTLKWQLKSHTNYKWSTDGILFNCQTGRIIKKTINGGSIGYWIKGKWYSLKALKYEVEIIKEIECPF
jgi:hypothetical protein